MRCMEDRSIEDQGAGDQLWLRNASSRLAGGSTALHNAVISLDYSAVDALIRNGAQVNATDPDGNTPLILAAGSNREDAWATIRTLLEAGAAINHVNSLGETALIQASKHGDTLRLTQLASAAGIDLSIRDNQGWDAVMHATSLGLSDILELLLDLGAPRDSVNNAGERAIDIAYHNMDRDCCYEFWKRGLYLNHVTSNRLFPHSPLTLCLVWKDTDLMNALVKEGSDPNARDHQGRTPLEEVLKGASKSELSNFVQQLCERGADPSLPMANGDYPLVFSARRLRSPTSNWEKSQFQALVHALIAAGAEPNSQDHLGNTALHYCGKLDSGKSELWRRLRQAGASMEIRNQKGRKPYFHCSEEAIFIPAAIGAGCCICVVTIPIGLGALAASAGVYCLNRSEVGNFLIRRKLEPRRQ